MSPRTPPKNVNAYLAALPAKSRAALQNLRKQIKAAAPNAVEGISYQIPTFKLNGPLVAFAAFPNHCSFFVMSPRVIAAHKVALKPYALSTGTIRFPTDNPLPAALVKKLVLARLRENSPRSKKINK